ncbi:hypothetical protein [Campylobacter lanienae]|uniref:hypothetical protein n=1 Tax=Campylobacter lanienae TaxID=75658 RepID=UPI0015D69BAB|nr:hypothetical protein [Campylobacter lanienae]
MALCGVKFGFVCSVLWLGGEFLWVVFLLLGGGISSLWVAFLDTTAEFSGEIWQW